MFGGFIEQMAPQVKPTLDAVHQNIQAIRRSLEKIEANTIPTPRAEKEPKLKLFPLNADTQKLNIVRLILSADTAGLYHLNVGSYTLLSLYISANTPSVIDLTDSPLTLARGVKMDFVADTGTPKIAASAVCYGG